MLPSATAPTSPPAGSQRLSQPVVEDLLASFQSASGELYLDLRVLDTIERGAGAILSNALLGTLGQRPLRVLLGGGESDWMTTSGLAFALANRPGSTIVLDGEDAAPRPNWRRDWRPGHVEPLRSMMPAGNGELFAPEELGETSVLPDLFGSSFAAFVNPHLTQPQRQRHPLTTLLWPWLDRLLPHALEQPVTHAARGAWVEDVGGVVDEVLGNVCEHARRRDGPRVFSLVQVSVTRGGGQRSSNRLHLCVHDTGPGIPATARPKVPPSLAAAMNEQQLVAKLIEGTLQPWGRGRGQGLPRVADICRHLQGTLRVATKTTRVVIEAQAENSAIRTHQAAFCLNGTVVTLTLPVPGL